MPRIARTRPQLTTPTTPPDDEVRPLSPLLIVTAAACAFAAVAGLMYGAIYTVIAIAGAR